MSSDKKELFNFYEQLDNNKWYIIKIAIEKYEDKQKILYTILLYINMANEDIISEKFIQYVAAAGDKAFENMSVEDLKTTIISILKSDIELAEKTPLLMIFKL